MSLEKEFVHQCHTVIERMGGFLSVVGQRDSRKSGSTLGFPDLVLMRNGQIRLIEAKRGKDEENPAGHLNLGQIAFIAAALEQGVEVEVVDNIEDFVKVVNSTAKPRGVVRRELPK